MRRQQGLGFYEDILEELDDIEANGALDREASLAARAEALANLDFAREVLAHSDAPDVAALSRRVRVQVERLEALDARLMARLSEGIRDGSLRGTALRRELMRLDGAVQQVATRPDAGAPHWPRYDAIDLAISGVLCARAPERVHTPAEAEMVALEPTPGRVILALIDRLALTARDTFVDLGAGLGQVAMVVRLLTEARAEGVEIEESYVAYARATAARLAIDGVTFECVDARAFDTTRGTVFYLFTPFRGEIMRQVLARLRAEAERRIAQDDAAPVLRVASYGPCNETLAQVPWLRPIAGRAGDVWDALVHVPRLARPSRHIP